MLKKRFFGILFAVALVFGLVPSAAFAANPIDTDVVIHKRDVASGTGAVDHDGTELQTPPGDPMPGVIFKYWTISNTATAAQMAAIAALQDIDEIEAYATANPTVLTGGTQTAATDTNGQVIVSAMPEGKYIFGEVNGASHNVTEYIGVPFLLELPAMKTDGTGYFGTGAEALHVYPKNAISSPGLEVETIDEKRDNFNNKVRIGPSAFRVEAYNTATSQYETVGSIGANGIITLGGGHITLSDLPAGSYRLINTLAPVGFVKDERPINFSVAAGQVSFDAATSNPKSSFTPAAQPGDNPLITLELNREAEVEKEEDAGGTATVGEAITWTVDITVPTDIDEYAKFEMRDTIDSRLDFSGLDKITVTVDGTALVDPTNYTASYTDSTRVMAIVFNPASLGSYEGKTIVVTYETVINDSAVMGEEIPNHVVIDYNNGHGMESEVEPPVVPTVWTGGAKFKKIDGSNSSIVLPGAEFKIATDAAGTTFLKWTQDLIDIATNPGSAGALANLDFKTPAVGDDIVMVSNNSGVFGMVGLKGGTYYLVETKAPNYNGNQYNLLRDPRPFVVSQTSFEDTATMNVENNTGLQIPQTGGVGTVLFTVIGVALMGCAIVLFRKKRKPSNAGSEE